jgi:hypothetical protein
MTATLTGMTRRKPARELAELARMAMARGRPLTGPYEGRPAEGALLYDSDRQVVEVGGYDAVFRT